jgi:hypothetical protein
LIGELVATAEAPAVDNATTRRKLEAVRKTIIVKVSSVLHPTASISR